MYLHGVMALMFWGTNNAVFHVHSSSCLWLCLECYLPSSSLWLWLGDGCWLEKWHALIELVLKTALLPGSGFEYANNKYKDGLNFPSVVEIAGWLLKYVLPLFLGTWCMAIPSTVLCTVCLATWLTSPQWNDNGSDAYPFQALRKWICFLHTMTHDNLTWTKQIQRATIWKETRSLNDHGSEIPCLPRLCTYITNIIREIYQLLLF